MIGYCNKVKKVVLSEAECYFCKEIDLTCCRYWRNYDDASNTINGLLEKLKAIAEDKITFLSKDEKEGYRKGVVDSISIVTDYFVHRGHE